MTQSDIPKTTPTLPFTFKANLTAYKNAISGLRIVVALGLSLFIWFRFGFVSWLIFVAAIAVIIGVIIWFWSHRSVTVNDKGIHYKNGFGIVDSVSYGDIESVYVFTNYIDLGFGATPRVIVAKKTGGALVSLTSLLWAPEDMTKFLAIISDKKLPAKYTDEAATGASISKQFPAIVPYYERHPYVTAAIIVALLVVATVIFVLLTM